MTGKIVQIFVCPAGLRGQTVYVLTDRGQIWYRDGDSWIEVPVSEEPRYGGEG